MLTAQSIQNVFEVFQAAGKSPTPEVLTGQQLWADVLCGMSERELVAGAYAWLSIGQDWPCLAELRCFTLGMEPTNNLLCVWQ